MPKNRVGPKDHPTSTGVGTLCQTVVRPALRYLDASVDLTRHGPVPYDHDSSVWIDVHKQTWFCTEGNFIRQDNIDSSHSLCLKSQSAEVRSVLSAVGAKGHLPKQTISSIALTILRDGAFNQETEARGDVKTFQLNVCAAPASNNEHIAKTPPGKISLQTMPAGVEVTRTEQGLESSPLVIADNSLVEPEIGVSSTPPLRRREPTLASPVQLGAEANVQSTPPTSPMKLSSPPSSNQRKRLIEFVLRRDAPFRNPRPGPIRCGLPTTMSSLPPSSPLPMLASSPSQKRPHVDSDTEDQPCTKVRRTGTSARRPIGGFSTPLRPSIVRYENFSSPILPTQPDVFTTPATAARSSPAYRPSTTLEYSSATPTSISTSYKLRPLRTVIRPFKPPAKSNRPTTATVQAQRQRLQLLRNALRIRGLADPTRPVGSAPVKQASNDEELEALALQWRSAAQEAAQDLWALPDGWGWCDKAQHASAHADYENTEEQGLDDVGSPAMFTPPPADKVHHSLLKNLNRPVVPRKTLLPPYEVVSDGVIFAENEDSTENIPQDKPKYHTLGTLLTSLGIPHEVLGWQEDEGEFMN
ncbi:hypothetical protein RHS01_01573 [Rhizoctonia solani]|uniref:Uncharacterized protein n=1 Tax=Rhizoctonia solani TaxID=456999 RepID=A0A8H7ILV9_9AGAM|nr:hypothetical protein RHS01_01573 [Rhizoctonia solani]